MKHFDWNDLRLFLAVARAGGLSAAAARSGASPATLGRRMTALERSLGTRLFHRRRDGYALTQAGSELLSRGADTERAVLSIERWSAASAAPPVVRIACGSWTSAFLAAHAGTIAGTAPRLRLEIVTGSAAVDLVRREADLGIRNRRPTTPGLAGRKLGPIAFAAYAAAGSGDKRTEVGDADAFLDSDWILFRPSDIEVPSAAWLERRITRQPVLRCSDARTVLDAAAAGAGRCILPCFIGDADSRLVRISGPIPELAHEQWLVSHDEDRHNRPIRVVANRIAGLVRGHRALFAGEKERAADPGDRPPG